MSREFSVGTFIEVTGSATGKDMSPGPLTVAEPSRPFMGGGGGRGRLWVVTEKRGTSNECCL